MLFAQFPCSTGFNGNGTDEFIVVPNTDAINIFTVTDRTIEFWFKPKDITTRQVIYKEGGGTRAIFFFLDGGRIYLGAYRNETTEPEDRRIFRSLENVIEVGKWNHVALVLDSSPSLLKWFLNGIEQDSQTGFNIESHSGSISYGRNVGGIRYPSDFAGSWSASGGKSSETLLVLILQMEQFINIQEILIFLEFGMLLEHKPK